MPRFAEESEALVPTWMLAGDPRRGLTREQVPDTGAESYVRDMLRDRFGEDLSRYAQHWVPIGILGTLDWVAICGWWAWTYTGIFHSSEAYKWIFRYHGDDPDTGSPTFYEFDPDMIMMFLEDIEQNAFEERFGEPGLTDRERAEVIQFLTKDVFESLGVEPPDQLTAEMLIYCTFMWVLSDNGREWLCTIDPIWNCVDQFRVAYLERWQNSLLDPRKMERTEREIGTCMFCNTSLHCVQGAAIHDDWAFVCNDCFIAAAEMGAEVDEMDGRLKRPLCGFRGGRCLNTECPHNPIKHEDMVEAMAEAGAKRVDAWRTARIESMEPRKLAGMTVDEIIDYFK